MARLPNGPHFLYNGSCTKSLAGADADGLFGEASRMRVHAQILGLAMMRSKREERLETKMPFLSTRKWRFQMERDFSCPRRVSLPSRRDLL
jgi:hypothetical protein